MFANSFWAWRGSARASLLALAMAVQPMLAGCGGSDGGAGGQPSVAPGGPPNNAPGQTSVDATIATLCSKIVTGCPNGLAAYGYIGWTVERCNDEFQTMVRSWTNTARNRWSEDVQADCLRVHSDGCDVLDCYFGG